MPELSIHAVPSIVETLSAFKDVESADFAVLLGVASYLFLLSLSLAGIDRRCNITAWSYIAFCTAAASLVILAIPMCLASRDEADLLLIAVGTFASLAALRWIWGSKALRYKASIVSRSQEAASNGRK